jgi:hypothetical protein
MDGRKKAAQTTTTSKTENSLVKDFIYLKLDSNKRNALILAGLFK